MNTLFLSWWWPYPANNGSKLRVYNLLRQLARQHRVTLLAFAFPGEATPESVAALRQFCADVHSVPRRDFNPGTPRALAGFFSRWPRSLVDVYSAEMAERVQVEIENGGYDLVVASELQTTPYILKLQGIAKLVEEIQVASFRGPIGEQMSLPKRMRSRLTWTKLAHYLRQLRDTVDGLTMASQIEADYVNAVAPGNAPLCVVPNGVDCPAYEGNFGAPEPDTLIYPGSLSYSANYDAAAWFVRDILPIVAARRPGVKFTITGSTKDVNLDAFPCAPQVRFSGYLEDVRPAFAQSWVCVVPLRTGGGTRVKILEAMALGTPVVATTKGAEGLDVTPGRDILVADEPQAFADAVVRVLDDQALRASLAAAGRERVRSQYDWSIIGKTFLRFVAEIASFVPLEA